MDSKACCEIAYDGLLALDSSCGHAYYSWHMWTPFDGTKDGCCSCYRYKRLVVFVIIFVNLDGQGLIWNGKKMIRLIWVFLYFEAPRRLPSLCRAYLIKNWYLVPGTYLLVPGYFANDIGSFLPARSYRPTYSTPSIRNYVLYFKSWEIQKTCSITSARYISYRECCLANQHKYLDEYKSL